MNLCNASRRSLALYGRYASWNSPVIVVVVTLSEAVVAVTVAVTVLVSVDGACVVVARCVSEAASFAKEVSTRLLVTVVTTRVVAVTPGGVLVTSV